MSRQEIEDYCLHLYAPTLKGAAAYEHLWSCVMSYLLLLCPCPFWTV